MDNIILKANKRENKLGKGALNSLRKEGILPAVVYGSSVGSIPITVERRDIISLLNKYGSNVVLTLQLEGIKPVKAMIKEIQTHPVTGNYWHIDLTEISMTKKIRTEVPVSFNGEPKGVKDGGIVQYGDTSVEVECLPGDIPEYLSLDISNLDIGENLTVADLVVEEKFVILSEIDKVLVNILAPQMEEEEEETEETPTIPEDAQEEAVKEEE